MKNSTVVIKASVLAAGLALPGLALAHPDHTGATGAGVLHFVSDPFHVGASAVAVALAWAVSRTVRRRAHQRHRS